MKKITIYCDGACIDNPGPGGYCTIVMCDGQEKILSGAELDTTNNRMELLSAILGMEMFKDMCEVDLYTDSAYVCNAIFEGWIDIWQGRHWKNSSYQEVSNKDLWVRFYNQINFHEVTIHKVTIHRIKGHSDDKMNDRCETIAKEEIIKLLSDKGLSKKDFTPQKCYIRTQKYIKK